jgi:hypothetical protein
MKPGWPEPSRVVRQRDRRRSRSAEAPGRAGALGRWLAEAPGVTGRATCSDRIRRSPWHRLSGRDDDVVLQSGDPWTASPSEARSDLAEDVVDAEGVTASFQRQDPSLQDRSVL